jgi:hypothetical protein
MVSVRFVAVSGRRALSRNSQTVLYEYITPRKRRKIVFYRRLRQTLPIRTAKRQATQGFDKQHRDTEKGPP